MERVESLCFFFFKQKTAYEMRISDWSSDVCSSDLDEMSADVLKLASDFLAREAWLLDTRAWNDWLALYAEDAVFWVPTWLDDDAVATDPYTPLSFMYVEGRRGLRERIDRKSVV